MQDFLSSGLLFWSVLLLQSSPPQRMYQSRITACVSPPPLFVRATIPYVRPPAVRPITHITIPLTMLPTILPVSAKAKVRTVALAHSHIPLPLDERAGVSGRKGAAMANDSAYHSSSHPSTFPPAPEPAKLVLLAAFLALRSGSREACALVTASPLGTLPRMLSWYSELCPASAKQRIVGGWKSL